MSVERCNSPAQKQLYKTVKQALNKWGKVQDTEGILKKKLISNFN